MSQRTNAPTHQRTSQMTEGGRAIVKSSLLIANWKMYKTVEESASFARLLTERLRGWWNPEEVGLVVAPTAVAIFKLAQSLADGGVQLAAQNMDLGTEGAFTGALSAYLLHEAGARLVILGHSERRRYFAETDALVAEKVEAAWHAGLTPVVCIGETESERDRGETETVLERQLAAILKKPLGSSHPLIIAYEPVWAIGTGRVAQNQDVGQLAHLIRRWLDQVQAPAAVPILYGGSVNPENLAGFLSLDDVDGALIGGASLSLDHVVSMVKVAMGARQTDTSIAKG